VPVTSGVERELKLSAPARFRLPAFDDLGAGLTLSDEEVRREASVYYDTRDLRLTRWDCCLRHRSSDGWTAKLAGTGVGSALERRELRFDGVTRRPPAEAVDLLRAVTRGAPLAPVARIRTLRRVVAVADANGRTLAEVTNDHVAVLEGGRVGRRFREVEVEFAGHCPPQIVEALVARLMRAGTGPVHRVAKHVRALGLESGVVPEVSVPEVGPEDPAGLVVRRALALSVLQLVRHDAGVRLDEDPEDVHRLRVATRRLRSHLGSFRPLLDADWARGLQEELRWLADPSSPVRDADVLGERLRRAAREIPEAEARAVKDLLERLAQERQRSLEQLLQVMRTPRYEQLVERLIEAARAPRLREPSEGAARETLAPLLQRRWKRLARRVRRLGQPPSAAELHAVRIAAKHARYACEAATPVYGDPARSLARALRRVQQALGEHQDASVAEAWLRGAGAGVGGRAAFAAGMLASGEERASRSARARWRRAWRRAAEPRRRDWLRAALSTRRG
jgi:CHAD domain-containing protein